MAGEGHGFSACFPLPGPQDVMLSPSCSRARGANPRLVLHPLGPACAGASWPVWLSRAGVSDASSGSVCAVSSWCTALEPFCLVCYECGSEYLAPPQGKVRRGTSEQSDIKVHSPGVLALCTQPLLPPGLAQVETALPGCGGPDPRGCPSSPQGISPGMVLVPMLSVPVCLPAALLPSPMVGAESIEAV